jgi:hypothetical protein|tara:strand:- start:10630 stop:10920 length:291 start_codon:yes stop_codon:yes gene_type:complete
VGTTHNLRLQLRDTATKQAPRELGLAQISDQAQGQASCVGEAVQVDYGCLSVHSQQHFGRFQGAARCSNGSLRLPSLLEEQRFLLAQVPDAECPRV